MSDEKISAWLAFAGWMTLTIAGCGVVLTLTLSGCSTPKKEFDLSGIHRFEPVRPNGAAELWRREQASKNSAVKK